MRLVVLLLIFVVALSGHPAPGGHQGVVIQSGNLGSIIVGLMMCAPLFGLFVLLRTFGRWQRSLNIRSRR